MDWAGFLKSESSPAEKRDGLVGWAEALATIQRQKQEGPAAAEQRDSGRETKEAKESFLSRVSKAKLLSSAVEKPPADVPKYRDILLMENHADMRVALKKFLEANPEALTASLSSNGGRKDTLAGNSRDRITATPYLLFEASEAHNLYLCVELLKSKATCTAKAVNGNLPIHALMRSAPPINLANNYAQTAPLYDEVFRLTVRVAGTRSVLDALNDRGESPLFLASVAANFVAVSQLIAAQVNVFSAFMPDVRVASHGATFLSVHDAIMSAAGPPEGLNNSGGRRGSKDERRRSVISRASKRRSGHMADALLRKVEAMPVMVERPYTGTGSVTIQRKATFFTLNIFSPNDAVLTALAREPLADKTVELLTQQFTAAYKATDSWVLMQQLQLAIDRISPIKEERGRYYIGFSSQHEVLRCMRDSVVLHNATEKSYTWSVRKYFPDLSVWDPATVRLEILGQRTGILRPQDSARLSFNLLATTKVEFAELVQIVLQEEGAPVNAQRALYFFLAAAIAPPADLKDAELDRSQVPPLVHTNRIGVGASAEVFKVANFLDRERSRNYEHLAVKKFHLRLEQGLEEAKEDFRRLTLELYISCKMDHPNVVHTLGFIASPLCLVMEFVETNLRTLIDDKAIPLGPAQQNKIALHIAKGMEYLHSYNVTHRDLKPANVLITSQYDAKITDFGISILNDDSASSKRKQPKEALEGTTLYMAPENFLGGENRFQKEGDVYSFGVILLELSMRISLIHELPPDSSRITFVQNRKLGMPPLPWDKIVIADTAVVSLIRACWAFEPDARPTFSQIVASVTEARRAALQLDLDSEMEEARREGTIPLLLENWAARFDDPDAKRAAKFRGDFLNSRAMSAVMEHLLSAPQLSEDEIGHIDRILRGHFGRCPSDLTVNLRSLQPGLASLAASPTIPFLINSLTDALVGAELRASGTIAPRLGQLKGSTGAETKIDLPGVFGWLEFSNSVRRDIRHQPAIGPLRYQTERESLQARMAELQAEMARCQRRLAKIDSSQDAVAYVGALMGLDPPPAHLPLAVLDRLDGDTAALIRQTTETAHAIDALAQCKTEAELRQRQAALETRLSTALAAAQAVQNAYPSVVSLMEKLPPEELQASGVSDRLLALPESWEMLSAAISKLRAHMASAVASYRLKFAAQAQAPAPTPAATQAPTQEIPYYF